ncbi:MAG: choice-of-anchor D domain-containing protein, partial [Candidatus Cloacimonetes bacterium]|nr:choice-of-anchor D domain-containing protein [Candidatus Cloacimonadota bacterium]
MKKLLFLTALIFILGSALVADISEYYEFTAGTQNYTEITGTAVTAAQGDDVMSGAIDIGFSFVYGDNTYTQIKIVSNGYITLGTTPGSTLANQLASTSFCPVVAALWDDLHTGRVQDATYPQTSSVQYLLQGTAPNRTFTVQYKYAYWYYSVTTSWVNFQIVLKENGGIDFLYGTNAGTSPGTSASASIGINMLPGGATNYWSVNPTTGTASNTTETANISAYITPNTKYSFNPPLGVPNDLSAVSIMGSTTPTSGNSTPYTITVRNRGTLQQTTYSVKLMSGTTELATVAGPTIAPGTNAAVVVNWTPATQGPMQIFGKVVLAGDQNTTNDQTGLLNITVMPPGSIIVTVGDGSQTANYMPVNMYWKNSLFENIYMANEMTAGGMLTAITFYNNFITNLPNMPTKIWLGLTTQTDLSAGWILSPALTLVYDGNVNYPSGLNEILIPLQTPFPFAGGNLVMLVQRPMDTQYYSSSDLFYTQTVGTNRARYIYSDTDVYDPTTITGGTLTGMFPKTTFTFVSTGTTPQFAISPQSFNFGQRIINTTNNTSFNVMNVGGGTTPLVINSITISGSPFFTLQNLPTLPASLNSGQSTNFTVRYQPTAAGNHTATVTVTDNLTRTAHPVVITASCIDPQIYTSPYFQNFNAVTVPSLPLDWSKLEISPSYANTSTTTPYSAPNSVYLYSNLPANGPYLIAPPVAATLPLTAMRTRFWARGTAATYVLSVGVMSDPTNAASYTQVTTINMTTTWTEYAVGFQTYTGQGNFITFKPGGTGTYQYIYIDDVTIETISANDLAALSITGNTTPSVGAATNYTVNLFNWGTAPQSNYQVKLYDGNNLELASVAGPAIAPGTTAQAVISWAPTAQGPMVIYGKVVLTGDANNTNDQTPNLNLVVQPAGTIVQTIGDGSQTSYQMPVNMFYKTSMYQNIYTSDLFTAGGVLTTIAFYNNFLTNLPNKPTKIWLGVTNLADLSAGWISSNDLTLVFNGNVNYPSGINTITIPLDTPYPYAGGNLVMLVERPMDIQYFSTSDLFYTQTVGTNRARFLFSDTVVYDPTNLTGGTLTGMFPKTTFFFTASGNTPQFAISPASYNYGQTLINTTLNKSFNIMNVGGGTTPLIISSITITGSPFFTLQNLPTLPASLTTGQSTSFVARYNPITAGNHTATITITDNLDRTYSYEVSRRQDGGRTQHQVALTATAVDVTIYSLPYFQNFDAVTTPNLPIDWSKIFTSPGNVTTVTTSPNSAPNCVYIYNSTSTAGPYLIAPPIVPTIPMVTTRVRFKAKGSTSYVLSVGVIADPTDAATYTQVSSITLTTAWVEYVVGFQTYAGQGRYITFKHGNASTIQSIYVDDVMIEIIADNDLAALSLTGNVSPSVGNPSNYTVAVSNWGNN